MESRNNIDERSARIKTTIGYELQFWADRLGTTRMGLVKAIRDAGSSQVDLVQRFLCRETNKLNRR